MANLSLRIPDESLARFDVWASAHGGRAPALRLLIDQTTTGTSQMPAGRLPPRPVKLTVRLTREDGGGLACEAARQGMTANAWAAALVRHRLHGRPAFARPDELALIAMQGELRRIGVNVNQIARALNTAVMEGKVLELELSYLESLRIELRTHMTAMGEAFAGNLAYWEGER